MRHSILAVPTALAFLGGMFVVACSEETSDPLASDHEATTLLLSHSPGHDGGGGASAVVATPDYAGLDDAAAAAKGNGVELTANAAGSIPRRPDEYIESVAVFGYAWVDAGTGKGIVAVIHPVIGRDSRQNPDGWHTHPVQLAAGTKPAGTSDFCIVSIGRSQGGIAIHDDVIRVHMSSRWAGISADALDVTAAFIVQQDAGCAPTGLGVAVLDSENL